MVPLEGIDLAELRDTLKLRQLDGWLLFDFRGGNPIAHRVVQLEGMLTRRVFVWLPAVGDPHAMVHIIDRHAFKRFPGTVDIYTRWGELHQRLSALLRGRRVAMEISPEDAVPYLDRVPAGVVELLGRLGATVVPSAPLVTRFAAAWSARELEQHRRVAESLASIARTTLARVIGQVGQAREVDTQQQVLREFEAAGWVTEDPPIVAFGAHAADPHFETAAGGNPALADAQVVLLDLWAKPAGGGMWADQTWMAFAGDAVPQEVARVWHAVRDAREAAVERLRQAHRAGTTLTGADVDTAARQVISARGYGDAFVHRTGHSIDVDLHGSGPHIDDFETHDVRELLPGIGFSIEPGVYLPGRFGVRSEINVYLAPSGPEVTPAEPEQELIVRA